MDTVVQKSSFWNAVNILITKPHVVNKRLWGYVKLHEHMCEPLQDNWDNELSNLKLINEGNIESSLNKLLKDLPIQLVQSHDALVQITIVELLPKSYQEKHAYQLICMKKNEKFVTFYDITPNVQNLCPNFPYSFYEQDNKIQLKCNAVESKSKLWLEVTVLPQIIKWAQEVNTNPRQICTESLCLVPKDVYYEKYNYFKLKYGTEMVKIWPESTDPLKFVYEDVAIATYLILIWDNKKTKSQKFIDIGCGNGLLVYILTMEGHNGLGIDVRKRKIWDLYPKNIKLKEHTIDPSNDIFSNYDWIIGNHSDELTPWIPAMAAKSSYKCNFFLLPCCAFNFNGSKYQRKNTSISQYYDYLLYIRKLCDTLGFEAELDRLKIPSTKRTCFVSTGRSYSEEQHAEKLDHIQMFIYTELGVTDIKTIDGKIKLRESKEKVQNCTQLDKTVIKYIITEVTNYLLKDIVLTTEWSAGKREKLSELVNLIPVDILKVLKSECGGLQTLLKNNHHIFHVQSGYIQLRYPKTIEEVKHKLNKNKTCAVKTQVNKCWFYAHHPQGCPLHSTVCSYLHEKT